MVNSKYEIDSVGDFFDEHLDFYREKKAYHAQHDFFIEFMRNENIENATLLDIGSGSGKFIKSLQSSGINLNMTALDPSEKSLEMIKGDNISKIVGKLPDQINLTSNFSYIHLQDVLHHVTGNSIDDSKKAVLDSLVIIKNNLHDDGFLFLGDMFYESYVIPKFTRSLIKYMLRLQNKYRIKIPIKEFFLDLDVCFYTRNEIDEFIQLSGLEVVDYRERHAQRSLTKTILILKNWGSCYYIIKKRDV